jgi:signal transduction histidine kinase
MAWICFIGLFAEEALPALFEKYTQASTTHARQYGGTGLGLAICKNLVHHAISFPHSSLTK